MTTEAQSARVGAPLAKSGGAWSTPATMKRRQLLRYTGIAAACAALPRPAAMAAPGLRARLGVTSDEISDDLEVALKFLESYELGWVELRRLWGQYVTELSLEDCKRARVLMDRHKVRLSVLDTALYKCDLPGLPSGRKEDYPFDQQAAVLARALERAPILGTRHIRIFSFWRPKDTAAAAAAATWKRIVEEVGKSAEKARKAGATLLLENVNGANAETSVEAARLLAAIPSRGFGLAWDPNNAFCGGRHLFPRATGRSTASASSTSTCATRPGTASAAAGSPWARARSTTSGCCAPWRRTASRAPSRSRRTTPARTATRSWPRASRSRACCRCSTA